MEDFTLPLAEHNAETDSVMTARSLPAVTGNGPWNLHCGGCGEVIAKGLNPASIAHAFQTDRRLLLECTCGAHNLVREAQDDSATPTATDTAH